LLTFAGVPNTHQARRLQADGDGPHSALEAVRLGMVAQTACRAASVIGGEILWTTQRPHQRQYSQL
jgi:hypothetical protein